MLLVYQNLNSSVHFLGREKKSWFSSAPSSNFYKKRKTSQAPRQILSLGKHVKCMHFSDMVFFNFQKNKKSLAIVIFLFFFWEPRHLFYNFPPKKEFLTLVIFQFFSDENQDIYFSWRYVFFHSTFIPVLQGKHIFLYWC